MVHGAHLSLGYRLLNLTDYTSRVDYGEGSNDYAMGPWSYARNFTAVGTHGAPGKAQWRQKRERFPAWETLKDSFARLRECRSSE